MAKKSVLGSGGGGSKLVGQVFALAHPIVQSTLRTLVN